MNVGASIGPYRVVSMLGHGGMGTVWLAEHELLGTRVAIKLLLPELSQRADIVQRFFDEARAAGKIAHPGIVTVIDFGWHPSGSAYLIMEHLVGETVAARVRRSGPFAIDRAVGIARECAIAIAAAHARGIIHRDLKPDNIFLTPDPVAPHGERVKVLDFGIAKLLDKDPALHPHTDSDMIMGTPAFMAPEQCRGAGRVDARADIYALGCVLFHLACGRPPFVGDAPGELIASHLREPPPRPSDLVPGAAAIDDVVARCLAKDPAERFASMEELAASLGAPVATRLVAPTTASASAPTMSTTLASGAFEIEPGARRWRGAHVVLAVALLGLGALTYVVVSTGRGAQAPELGAPASSTLVDAARTNAVAPRADAAELDGGSPVEPLDARPSDRRPAHRSPNDPRPSDRRPADRRPVEPTEPPPDASALRPRTVLDAGAVVDADPYGTR